MATLESQRQLGTAFSRFGFALFASLRSTSNELVSPYDLARALSMLERASANDTRRELDAVLSLSAGTASLEAIAALRSTIEASANRPGFALSTGARVWPARTLRVRDAFQLDALRLFGAPLEPLDFASDPDAQRRTINAWVSQQTRTRIPELLGPGSIDAATKITLTTALYFLGRWAQTFDVNATHPERFYLREGRAKTVSMMSGPVRGSYYDDGVARMLELPYQGDEFVMNLVIPAPGHRLDEVRARLDAATFERWTSAARTRDVVAVIPRFTLRKHSQLRGPIAALGARSLFANADLSNLTEEPVREIGEVVHEVFISVNETGTEAAAATAVSGYGGGAATPVFNVDQPFVFVLRHPRTNTVLFLGAVYDPSPETAEEPASGGPFVRGAPDPMIARFPMGLHGRGPTGPLVLARAPTVRGAYSPELLRRVVLRSLGRVTFCHEQALAQRPTAEGELVAHFTLDAEGVPRDVRVDGEYPVATAHSCVRDAFAQLRFAGATAGTVSVDYPIVLRRPD